MAIEVNAAVFDEVHSGDQVMLDTDRGLTLDRLPPEAHQNLLVVTTTHTPQRIQSAVEAGGGKPSDVGVIPVSGSGSNYAGSLWTADRVDPSDLTGLSMRFSDAARYLQPGEGWVLVDNFTVLLMYAPEENVYRLLSSLTSYLRGREIRGLYGVVQSAMDKETYQRFRGLFDDDRALVE